MQIPVLGQDPSLNHWGLAPALLDLNTGCLTTPNIKLIEPRELEGKQIRVNSNDLFRAEQLAQLVIEESRKAKAIFVEVPVGSQSARSMASYGICVGILGAVRALGIPIIEVTATESKVALTNNKNATKQQMIDHAWENYPQSPWLKDRNGKLIAKNEHMADAIGAIHAGVITPEFQKLMRLLS